MGGGDPRSECYSWTFQVRLGRKTLLLLEQPSSLCRTGLWPRICCRTALPSTDLRVVFLPRSPRWREQRDAQRWELEDSEASLKGLSRSPSHPMGSLPAKDVVGGHEKKPEAPGDLWELRRAAHRVKSCLRRGAVGLARIKTIWKLA